MNTKRAESKTFPVLSDENYKRATAVRRSITRKMKAIAPSHCGFDCGCWSNAPLPTCDEYQRSALRAEEWAQMLAIYTEQFGDDAVRWMEFDGLRPE